MKGEEVTGRLAGSCKVWQDIMRAQITAAEMRTNREISFIDESVGFYGKFNAKYKGEREMETSEEFIVGTR